MKIRFKIGAVSDIGLVRKNNEDNLFIPDAPIRKIADNNFEYEGEHVADKSFFSVCDGMGGHNAGEIASFMAVNCLVNEYENIINNVKKRNDIQSVMDNFVSNTNDYIYDQSMEHMEYQDMGTTMIGLFFYENGAYTVNVGDSRAYVLKGKTVKQLSEDHADPIATNAITRFLGMPDDMGIILPDVSGFPCKINSKKRFLLCSDGLSDLVSSEEIARILNENKQPIEAARALAEAAKQQSGRDNITVMVIDAIPVGQVKMILKQPAVLIVLAALIIAMGAKGYMIYRDINAPVDGLGIADVSNNVASAKNYKEAFAEVSSTVSGMEASYAEYNDVYNQYGDNIESIASARAKLKVSLDSYRSFLDNFEGLINEIETSEEKTQQDKYTELLNISDKNNPISTYSRAEEARFYCENDAAALKQVVDAYNKEQEQIKKERSVNNRTDSNNSNNSSSSSGSSSSGKSSGYSSGGGGGYSSRSSSGGSSSSSDSSSSGKSSSSSGGGSSSSGGTSSRTTETSD